MAASSKDVTDTKNAANRTIMSYRRCIFIIIINSILIKYDVISLIYLVLSVVFSIMMILRKLELDNMSDLYRVPNNLVLIASVVALVVEILLLVNINL